MTGLLDNSLETSIHNAGIDKQLFKVGIYFVVRTRVGTTGDEQHTGSREYYVTQQLFLVDTRLCQCCLLFLDGGLIQFYDVEQTCRTFGLAVTGQREYFFGTPVEVMVLVILKRRHILIAGNQLLDNIGTFFAYKGIVTVILVFHREVMAQIINYELRYVSCCQIAKGLCQFCLAVYASPYGICWIRMVSYPADTSAEAQVAPRILGTRVRAAVDIYLQVGQFVEVQCAFLQLSANTLYQSLWQTDAQAAGVGAGT